MPPITLSCRGKAFTEPLPSNHRDTDTQALLLNDTSHTENDGTNNSSTVAFIRCSGNVSIEPVPTNIIRGIQSDILTDGRGG